jgi:hypothetical protein
MGASEDRGLPSDLALGRSRLQAWRRERKLGERIPRPLWDLAVRLARRIVQRTCIVEASGSSARVAFHRSSTTLETSSTFAQRSR